jgi:hypothetical protein
MEDPQRKYVLKELCDPVKEIVDLKGGSLFKHSRNGTCTSGCISLQKLEKNESAFFS